MHPMINIAVKAARRAGSIINRASMDIDNIRISRKQSNDFVTEVDRAAEAAIIEILLTAFPDHAVLGEENGVLAPPSALNEQGGIDPLTAEHLWIVDPLDGTTNFIHGMPQYAVSIALAQRGVVTQAVIYDPAKNELFVASKGRGAFLNDRRIRVTRRDRLDEALIGTGFPFRSIDSIDSYMGMFKAVAGRAAGLRRPGAAALDLAYVACGRYDGFFELGLSPWDIAAGGLLVQEAGGLIANFAGESDWLFGEHVIAGTPKVFGQLLQTLSPFETPQPKRTETLVADMIQGTVVKTVPDETVASVRPTRAQRREQFEAEQAAALGAITVPNPTQDEAIQEEEAQLEAKSETPSPEALESNNAAAAAVPVVAPEVPAPAPAAIEPAASAPAVEPAFEAVPEVATAEQASDQDPEQDFELSAEAETDSASDTLNDDVEAATAQASDSETDDFDDEVEASDAVEQFADEADDQSDDQSDDAATDAASEGEADTEASAEERSPWDPPAQRVGQDAGEFAMRRAPAPAEKPALGEWNDRASRSWGERQQRDGGGERGGYRGGQRDDRQARDGDRGGARFGDRREGQGGRWNQGGGGGRWDDRGRPARPGFGPSNRPPARAGGDGWQRDGERPQGDRPPRSGGYGGGQGGGYGQDRGGYGQNRGGDGERRPWNPPARSFGNDQRGGDGQGRPAPRRFGDDRPPRAEGEQGGWRPRPAPGGSGGWNDRSGAPRGERREFRPRDGQGAPQRREVGGGGSGFDRPRRPGGFKPRQD